MWIPLETPTSQSTQRTGCQTTQDTTNPQLVPRMPDRVGFSEAGSQVDTLSCHQVSVTAVGGGTWPTKVVLAVSGARLLQQSLWVLWIAGLRVYFWSAAVFGWVVHAKVASSWMAGPKCFKQNTELYMQTVSTTPYATMQFYCASVLFYCCFNNVPLYHSYSTSQLAFLYSQ